MYKPFIIIIFLVVNNFAQTIDPLSFFPSAVGNVWEYYYKYGDIQRTEIISDSSTAELMNYLFYSPSFYPNRPLYSVDEKNKIIYYDPTHLNWLYYKLGANLGDTWMVRPETPEITRMEAKVKAKYSSIIFGRSTIIMDITYYALNWGDTLINEYAWPRFTETLAAGFGEIMYFDEEGGGPITVLRGCIINNDTIGTITSIKDIAISPDKFNLCQNYPNPFNPSTKINFCLIETDLVTLKVYDILGKEIVTLINNEERKPGSYTVDFNGNSLSSGIYIYVIKTTEFTKARKMTLQK